MQLNCRRGWTFFLVFLFYIEIPIFLIFLFFSFYVKVGGYGSFIYNSGVKCCRNACMINNCDDGGLTVLDRNVYFSSYE